MSAAPPTISIVVASWNCAGLLQAYPIEHLAGHEHVAPGRKQDPGAGFDWLQLRNALGLPAPCFPRTPMPP